MKVFSVVGYKNSGKTSLISRITKELVRRGYTVSVVKHSHKRVSIDSKGKDTKRFKEAGAKRIGFISEVEKTLIFEKDFDLFEFFSLFSSDFLILEGFKSLAIPRISCDKELFDDLTILHYKGQKIQDIVSLIEKKTFPLLPNIDCLECGNDCKTLAKKIILGEAEFSQCVVLQEDVLLKIGGKKIPLKPFVKDMVKNTIFGLLKSLRGYEEGKIEIEIF